MTTETQMFLNAMKMPAVIAPDAIHAALATFLGDGAKVAEQVATWERLLQAAEIAETDASVRAFFDEGFQKFGALRREAERAVKAMRRIDEVLRELAAWHDRLRSAASDAGG